MSGGSDVTTGKLLLVTKGLFVFVLGIDVSCMKIYIQTGIVL